MNMQMALKLRDAGIQSSLDHAERVEPGWADMAYAAMVSFCAPRSGMEFVSHTFIVWVTNVDGLPEPPTDKAFGSIFTKAARNGLIRKVGYRPHPLRHCSPTVLWEVV